MVENLLVDHDDHVVAEVEYLERCDHRRGGGKLTLPVVADRTLVAEHGAVDHVGPLDIVGHHGEEPVDVAAVESLVGVTERLVSRGGHDRDATSAASATASRWLR